VLRYVRIFVQGSWDFDISGLPSGKDAMLSFAITGSPTVGDFNIWHFDEETGWTSTQSTSSLFLTDGQLQQLRLNKYSNS